jgi:hypothetical protein
MRPCRPSQPLLPAHRTGVVPLRGSSCVAGLWLWAAHIAQAAGPNWGWHPSNQGKLIVQVPGSLPSILAGANARCARLQPVTGIIAIASSLLAWTQPVASRELLGQTASETLRHWVIAQSAVSASPRMPSSLIESFFFGWLEFDFTPDESGNIPGFGKFESALPHQHGRIDRPGVSQNMRGDDSGYPPDSSTTIAPRLQATHRVPHH